MDEDSLVGVPLEQPVLNLVAEPVQPPVAESTGHIDVPSDETELSQDEQAPAAENPSQHPDVEEVDQIPTKIELHNPEVEEVKNFPQSISTTGQSRDPSL